MKFPKYKTWQEYVKARFVGIVDLMFLVCAMIAHHLALPTAKML